MDFQAELFLLAEMFRLMVTNLTVGKKKYADVEEEMKELMAKATTLQDELLHLIERDAEVFEPLSKAYGMPRETEEEKAEKARVMEIVLKDACSVPMEIMEKCCEAIDLIIHKGRVGEVYNIGGHNEMKNIDIVKLICKELGKPESLITYVADRKGHDMRYAIDPTKIHNELGWLPETKFADGIKKTIQWYLDNKEWWETIISGEYQNYYEEMYGKRRNKKV